MTGPVSQERMLRCGHPASAVADLVLDRDLADQEIVRHSATCPHCQWEIAELEAQWGAVRRAAAAPIAIPPQLVDRALGTVRGLRGRRLSEPVEIQQDGGRLTIGERPILLLVRQLAIELLEDTSGAYLRGLAGGDRRIEVSIAVHYDLPGSEVAAELARGLADRLTSLLGPAAPVVSVQLADVLD